jgi:riboflavin kinase/FMN adenylyltransferase
LEVGEVEEANALLTRPYGFEAEVVHGKALGKQWNTPTVNQYFPDGLLIPRHGVYVTENEVDGVCYRGVTNVGVHPTVDQDASVNCETHLLDFAGDLYGKKTKLSFLKFLRPEQKFESADALRAQIFADIEAVRNY